MTTELNHIKAGCLNVAYRDSGPSEAPVAILLHGFPYDICSYNEVSRILNGRGIRTITPYLRGYGATEFLSPDIPRSGEQAALGSDLLALMDALSLSDAVVAGYDWGGRAACIVSALWPDRVSGLVSGGAGYNIQDIKNSAKPINPEDEVRYWYQYYFHLDRGRNALRDNRKELCKFIWKLWSPSWEFDDKTYEETAASFENGDFVDVVVHSYRHRFANIAGDPKFADIEEKLARQPLITVPSIILQGADDTVDPPTDIDTAKAHFTGPYERHILAGVGHNIPQEAPQEFAKAVEKLIHKD
ncbi:alpha/beta fold hydrolase [Sneathiella limimaris]|uniref:alpha/beta fold hydrolase n=1 Tax=Sneathiella limimaris TaxID=1964213 RepID=UPI001469EEAE|nr:alpha/beta hydrolase [Sneathiella limimaris]